MFFNPMKFSVQSIIGMLESKMKEKRLHAIQVLSEGQQVRLLVNDHNPVYYARRYDSPSGYELCENSFTSE